MVVVGYGTERKADFTGGIAKMQESATYTSALQGRVAGVQIRVRGTSSLNAVNRIPIANVSPYDGMRDEEYGKWKENRFFDPRQEPLSTFSIDVDAASYSNMRRYVNRGQLPPADAVRIEEMINYFSYDYPAPQAGDPVRITTEVGACPWNKTNRLVRIGLKARDIAGDELPASNLVFLIDVSGSMYGPTRLELVKSSLKLLVNNLRDKDRVAIVVYAGATGEVLSSTSGANKQLIREKLDALTAGGSTAGGAGIQLAYSIARKNFIKNGNNRVILCTDGDFNVGVSSPEGLEKMIEEQRASGVFLTVLGYGMGNYKDNRLKVLSSKGNGNYAYIDNLQEANKTLVQEFGGTMYAVAKDVKLQIEFNPAHVKAYRLVGYESRLLNKEDFNNDAIDAGEMGAGHTVTAFYEVVPAGLPWNPTPGVDPLKYQKQEYKPVAEFKNSSPEMLTVKLRYKAPDGDKSTKIERTLTDNGGDRVNADFRFAAAVAMFGQIMRDSEFKGDATFDDVAALASKGLDNDAQGYRREFVRLAESAKGLK
jgi:Ca-activated chloride channel family protein